jgi:Mg2+ and Co2+ transporter CorA
MSPNSERFQPPKLWNAIGTGIGTLTAIPPTVADFRTIQDGPPSTPKRPSRTSWAAPGGMFQREATSSPIELLKPEPDEIAFVKRTTGLDVPSFEDLSEIESSSRMRSQGGAIYLSAPLVYRADSNQPLTTPVGFVLTSPDRCQIRGNGEYEKSAWRQLRFLIER